MCTFDGKPKQDTLSKVSASLLFIYVKINVYYSAAGKAAAEKREDEEEI
jgi:hypothetical protein